MQEDTFRAFFAIDIPENIKKTILSYTKSLHPLLSSKQIKWTRPQNLHLTLCFLGNITEQQYQKINKKIKKAAKTFPPFTMKLTTIQQFPSTKGLLKSEQKLSLRAYEVSEAIQEYIINQGIFGLLRRYAPRDDSKKLDFSSLTNKPHAIVLKPQALAPLEKLASNIKKDSIRCGIKIESRPFIPHVTLGRIGKRQKIDNKIFTEFKIPPISFKVTAIKLFKSEPQSGGSVYTPIAIYNFN
ncbi:MAG: RNA 2',3'-cyclic phosphodiesterase [Gammaproteobacteria bacterium]|nr:RNA 2',3'-cyclic phosphodiesterase [Gammaproteobacteria bacterium]